MDEVRITIIGAGVVGLAIAAELSKEYDSIVVVEKHEKFGQETSSRNSEVIHAGIYYPPQSLKAELCVEGAELLYHYCEKYSIPYLKIGKLIVATEDSEENDLQDLYHTGVRNRVKGLRIIGAEEVNTIEPNVNARAALYSPNTGIIDSHSFMSHLYKVAESTGVIFSFNTEVNQIGKQGDRYLIVIKPVKKFYGLENEDYRFVSGVVINSTGLSADSVAGLAGIDIGRAGYKLRYCKGSYFSYAKKSPIKMLVYPVPHRDLTGLGIHATLDLGGRLRFGPDTEYVDSIDYKVDAGKRDFFYESACRTINGLEREAFIPDMAGIRPKIQGEGITDFIIKHEAERVLEGFINLIGIESPGLTASLSIAKYIKNLIQETHFSA